MRFVSYMFLILVLAGCSEPAKLTKATDPGERVLQFLTSAEYSMLSEADRSVWSEKEWNDYAAKGIISQPRLSPTSKYFELETYLYSFSSLEVHKISENEDSSHTVTIIHRLPTVLKDVGFFIEVLMEGNEQKLDNLLSLYKNNQLDSSSLNYDENIQDYTVFPDGIFFNVEKIKNHQTINEKISQLFKNLSHIESYDLDLNP